VNALRDYFNNSAPLAGWCFAFSWLVGGQMSFAQAPNMMWNIIQAYVDKGKLNIVVLASLAQIILCVKNCRDFFYYYYFKKKGKWEKKILLECSIIFYWKYPKFINYSIDMCWS
jgi:hypothetical protein